MQSKQLLHVVFTGLLLSFNCQFIQDASAESSNPTTGVPKVKTPVKRGVQFAKVQIPSVDLTLQEVASLDKRIVEIRDTSFGSAITCEAGKRSLAPVCFEAKTGMP